LRLMTDVERVGRELNVNHSNSNGSTEQIRDTENH
jgi:hypothetical protein